MISVLMSTYKEPVVYFEQALKSILNQTYQNLEVVLMVDDSDNLDIIRSAEMYSMRDTRIRIFKNERNLGLVDSLNRGIPLCQGEYIARMDADDIAKEDRLEKQLLYLEAHHYDMVGAFFEQFDEKKEMKFEMPTEHHMCARYLREGSCLAHPTWLVKKGVYETLGGYRNIVACEDYDFIIRAVLAGYQVGNCPEYLLRYRVHNDSISQSKMAEQRIITNYLAKAYCKKSAISMDFYSELKKSGRLQEDIKRYEKLRQKVEKAKTEKKKGKKLFYCMMLLSEWDYVRSYLKNIVKRMY